MEFLLSDLPEQSVLYVTLRYLAFPLTLVAAGGFAANILFPRWQDRYLQRKARAERRYEIGEDILALMNVYVSNWRRVIEMASYEEMLRKKFSRCRTQEKRESYEKAIDIAVERKEVFVQQRGETRDKLMDAISRYKLYGSESELKQMQSFASWDEQQSTKILLELPKVEEWREWEKILTEAVSARGY